MISSATDLFVSEIKWKYSKKADSEGAKHSVDIEAGAELLLISPRQGEVMENDSIVKVSTVVKVQDNRVSILRLQGCFPDDE